MKIVIDTNIVFSALINASATIPEIIVSPFSDFRFYTSEYLLEELEKHKEKLQKASKLTEKEIHKATAKLFKYINTLSLEMIPQDIWTAAEDLTMDIDRNDTPFVALSIFLNAPLWTGDKILYNGLKNKGFDKVLSTHELIGM
ncbi:MAG: hypothetical protein LBE36_08505 [Flavobacteriaceae bacterium]|jgi:predicted nucleic acid-binding protein|nr:hypothetical protein [Flavobacteriaceae bacterium]